MKKNSNKNFLFILIFETIIQHFLMGSVILENLSFERNKSVLHSCFEKKNPLETEFLRAVL